MLTPKRQRFAQEYLIDLCATRAAIRAGYSARSANVLGPRLMKNPEVRAAIQVNMDARTARLNIAADTVLGEVAIIALHRMTVGLGRSYAPRIKTQSKQRALDQLKRHVGPYAPDVQKACAEHFTARLQADARAAVQAASIENPSAAVSDDYEDHPEEITLPPISFCDWLPPGTDQTT
jgi:phage terminase small subunit